MGAVSLVTNKGGEVYFPPGRYAIDADISVRAKPISFRGAGRNISMIVQVRNGSSGINFDSFTTDNMVLGVGGTDEGQQVSLKVSDLSFFTNAGGADAIKARWVTNNTNFVLCDIRNVTIDNDGDWTKSWYRAIHLTDSSGSRIDNVCFLGNRDVDDTTSTEFPYTMQYGIHYDRSAGSSGGCIDHFITNISCARVNKSIVFDGWYEGVKINVGELVHVGTGIEINGDGISLNPNFFVSNLHMDFRGTAIVANNCQNIHLNNCDVYKAGMAYGFAIAGSGAVLTNCPDFKVTGSKFQNIHSGSHDAVLVVGYSPFGQVIGNTFYNWTTGISMATPQNKWMVGMNVCQTVGTVVFFNGSTNSQDPYNIS